MADYYAAVKKKMKSGGKWMEWLNWKDKEVNTEGEGGCLQRPQEIILTSYLPKITCNTQKRKHTGVQFKLSYAIWTGNGSSQELQASWQKPQY